MQYTNVQNIQAACMQNIQKPLFTWQNISTVFGVWVFGSYPRSPRAWSVLPMQIFVATGIMTLQTLIKQQRNHDMGVSFGGLQKFRLMLQPPPPWLNLKPSHQLWEMLAIFWSCSKNLHTKDTILFLQHQMYSIWEQLRGIRNCMLA